ncbi:MAG: hypothetical protein AAF409_02655 [Pseudomonadota bacterium]
MKTEGASLEISFSDTDQGFKIKAKYAITSINWHDFGLKGVYEKEWKAQDVYPQLSNHGKKHYVKKLEKSLETDFTKHFDKVAGDFIWKWQQKTDIRDKTEPRGLQSDFKKFKTALKTEANKLVEGVKDKLMGKVKAEGSRDMDKVKSGAKDVTLGVTGTAVGGVATAHGGGAMSAMATVSSAVTALSGIQKIWTSRVSHGKDARTKLKLANSRLQEASNSFGELELAHQKLKRQLIDADKKVGAAQQQLSGPAKKNSKLRELKKEKEKLQATIKKKCIADLDEFKNLMANLEKAIRAMDLMTAQIQKAETTMVQNAQDMLSLAANIQTLVRR